MNADDYDVDDEVKLLRQYETWLSSLRDPSDSGFDRFLTYLLGYRIRICPTFHPYYYNHEVHYHSETGFSLYLEVASRRLKNVVK